MFTQMQKKYKLIILIGIFLIFFSCTVRNVICNFNYDFNFLKVERPSDAKKRYGESKIESIEEEGEKKYIFEDEMIRIKWFPTASVIFFSLTNKTEHSIKIIWDEAAYVNIDGLSEKIAHSGMKCSDTSKSLPPSIIIRGSTLNEIIVPSEHLYYSSVEHKCKNIPLLPDKMSLDVVDKKILNDQIKKYKEFFLNKQIHILLPLNIEGITNEYIFTFEITNCEIVPPPFLQQQKN